jgi:hypothetical protein
MGHGRWRAEDWTGYAKRNAGRSREQVFASRKLDPRFDPAQVAIREARDGPLNPQSTAIVLASDVTGSMGVIAEQMIRSGLDTTMREILERKPVPDPQVMAMAIGDAECDRAPLQVTQFEADIRLAEQLQELWIEGGGGGNRGESYHLAWAFAAMRTSIDCFERRRKKGYLFTIGDEPILPGVSGANLSRVLGGAFPGGLTSADMLGMASRTWDAFHILLTTVGWSSTPAGRDYAMRTWTPLLGQRVLPCDDPARVAEIVVSAIQVNEGADADSVAASWGGATGRTVAGALKALPAPGSRRFPYFL